MTAAAPPSAEERLAWLVLARSDGIGPLTFAGLVGRFGSAASALAALPGLKRQRGGPVRIASPDDVRGEMERAEASSWRFLLSCEPDYPAALRATDAAPPVLCVAGSTAVLSRPMVAIVGARNASANGMRFAERLALGLGGAGYVVASGLARGIDAQAHKAALIGGTVAVLAGGHERVYPPEHKPLAERIVAEGGAVVSEMPLGWEPRGRDFPRRNRIVSGLSLGTVVVEAAQRSGSLITARLASEQGREVFAVPGSPLDPRAEGTNDLLRQGATLCTRPADVIEALDPLRRDPTAAGSRPTLRFRDDPGPALSRLFEGGPATDEPPDRDGRDLDPRERVLTLLGPAPVGLDDLVRLSGIAAGALRVLLTELELSGEIDRRADGLLARAGR